MYITINDNNNELKDAFIDAVNGKQFVWAFRSMTVNIGVYRLTECYLVRTKNEKQSIFEFIALDDISLLNSVVKRETLFAQSLDLKQLEDISGLLRKIEPLDLSDLVEKVKNQ